MYTLGDHWGQLWMNMKLHSQTPILTTMLDIDGNLPPNFSRSHDFEAWINYYPINIKYTTNKNANSVSRF